jgi:5'(3')-deoxyribonucleotidase
MKAFTGRRIAVDMDEVLFPMISRLDKFYRKKYKKCPPSYYPKKYDYSTYYGFSTKESKTFVKEFYYSDIAYNTEPLPNAYKSMKALKTRNELYVVTGRQTYSQCKNVTYYLLEKHFPNIFEEVIFTNSYSLEGTETPKTQVCINKNLDLLIDDSVYNCQEVMKENIDGVLFGNYTWNDDCNELFRINSWEINKII